MSSKAFNVAYTRIKLAAHLLHLERSPEAWVQLLLAVQSSLHLIVVAPAAAAVHCTRGLLLAAPLEGRRLPMMQLWQGIIMQMYPTSITVACKVVPTTAPATGWPAACEGAAPQRLPHALTAAAPPVARLCPAAAAASLAVHLQPQMHTFNRCCHVTCASSRVA